MAEEQANSRLKILDIAIAVVATAMVIYHAAKANYYIQEPILHMNTHLAFAFVLTYLLLARSYRRLRPLMLVLGALALFATVYVHVLYDELYKRMMFNNALDLTVGIILLVLVLHTVWVRFGVVLSVIVGLFTVYWFVGPYLPGLLHTLPMSWDKIISQLTVSFSGIYNTPLNVSASMIFLFMIFGALMNACGATEFFLELGKWIGGRLKSGSALTAIITGGLVGTITGQAAASVSIIGSYCIPMMKRAGYQPEQAAAITAAAGTGALIIPPVMGAVAFLIAGITGIPYARIMIVAVVPALMYVISCGFYSHFQAGRLGIVKVEEKINTKELFLRAPLFLIPLSTIVILFITGYSPLYVSFWGCVSVLVLSMIRKETRPKFNTIIKAFVNGADLGSRIAVSTAGIGILMTAIITTGLGVKLAAIIVSWGGQNLTYLLAVTAVIIILMGCGVPASAGYIIVAVVIIPIMLRLGLPLLTAHFFAAWYTVFAFLTPPVALAALFASQMAGTNYMRTAVESAKVGIAGFLVPFMMVWVPAVLLDFSAPAISTIVGLIACIALLFGLQIGFVGYFLTNLSIPERIISFASAIVLILSLQFGVDYLWFFIGIGGLVALTLLQIARSRRSSLTASTSPGDTLPSN